MAAVILGATTTSILSVQLTESTMTIIRDDNFLNMIFSHLRTRYQKSFLFFLIFFMAATMLGATTSILLALLTESTINHLTP